MKAIVGFLFFASFAVSSFAQSQASPAPAFEPHGIALEGLVGSKDCTAAGRGFAPPELRERMGNFPERARA